MNNNWNNRNPIVKNLLNPAFCGEVIRVAANEYNTHSENKFPYLYSFLVLPIILHEETRQRLPRTTRTYIFAWVDENEDLLMQFPNRAKNMAKYTRESLCFLIKYNAIEMDKTGNIFVPNYRKTNYSGEEYSEYNDIMKKSKMLGKWLSQSSDIKSIYSFFRITP